MQAAAVQFASLRASFQSTMEIPDAPWQFSDGCSSWGTRRSNRRGFSGIWSCRPLLLEPSAKRSAKSKGMIGPVALLRGRSRGLLDVLNCPAQPKHHICPCPFGWCFRSEPLFQAYLERLGIGSLVFGCGWIREHGGNGSQFPMNSRGKPRLLADWHLRYPAVGSSSTGRAQSSTKPFRTSATSSYRYRCRLPQSQSLLSLAWRAPCRGAPAQLIAGRA